MAKNREENQASKRVIAVGDIHGVLTKLTTLIAKIAPGADERFIFLGDYIDRGPESKGVIEYLIAFGQQYPDTIFLRGNHEQMFLDALAENGFVPDGERLRDLSPRFARNAWVCDTAILLQNGGMATFANYGGGMGAIPDTHIEFIKNTVLIHREPGFVFAHGGFDPNQPIDDQRDPYLVLWQRDHSPVLAQLESMNLTLVHGHTPGPLSLNRIFSLDTGAVYGRELTACDVLTRTVWQV